MVVGHLLGGLGKATMVNGLRIANKASELLLGLMVEFTSDILNVE